MTSKGLESAQEWLLRVYLDRFQFLFDFANWFDTLCMVSGLVDMALRFGLEDSSAAWAGFSFWSLAFRPRVAFRRWFWALSDSVST